MVSILIVEDEPLIAEGIQHLLTQAHYKTFHAPTLAAAQTFLKQEVIDLVLLDIMLPDGNGLEFSKTLDKSVKVIFLSALDDEETIVKGFELGTEDYVTKPFRFPILLARIQAVINRHHLGEDNDLLKLSGITINKKTEQIFYEDTEISLTKNEHRLFFYLLKNANQILSREQLLDYMWDSQGEFVNDNTLTVTLKRLRKKIEKEAEIIETIRGLGYRIKL